MDDQRLVVEQWEEFVAALMPGDLVFFCNDKNLSRLVRCLDAPWNPAGGPSAVNHVAIFVGGGAFIQANRDPSGWDAVRMVLEDLGWRRAAPGVQSRTVAQHFNVPGLLRHRVRCVYALRARETSASAEASRQALQELQRAEADNRSDPPVTFSLYSLVSIAMSLLGHRTGSDDRMRRFLPLYRMATRALKRVHVPLDRPDGDRKAFCSEFVFTCFVRAGAAPEILPRSEDGLVGHPLASSDIAVLSGAQPLASNASNQEGRNAVRWILRWLLENVALLRDIVGTVRLYFQVNQACATPAPPAVGDGAVHPDVVAFAQELVRVRGDGDLGELRASMLFEGQPTSGDFVSPADLFRSPSFQRVGHVAISECTSGEALCCASATLPTQTL